MSQTKEKLLIEEIKEEQFDQLVDLLRQSDLSFFSIGDDFNNKIKRLYQRAFVFKNKKRRSNFIMAIMAGDILVGYVSMKIDSHIYRRSEMGIFVADKYKGNGYATAAMKSMIDYAFNQLNQHRIIAKVAVLNLGSIKVMQNVGMELEGVLKDYRIYEGKRIDSLLFAIINSAN